jgi:putative flavoprotein involved in K+ transport
MQSTTVVIIGAGQAGLAMSRCLTDHSIDHVVLERAGVANAWRTQRWDSLRLLTPNWMTRLPGFQYTGDDPDGYMTAAQVARFLTDYGDSFNAPVQTGTSVDAVYRIDGGGPFRPGEPDATAARYAVRTNQGEIRCRAVVVATGACNTPKIPTAADQLPGHIQQITPIDYRNPDQIEDGGVLVVGASASGAQIADELARAGRRVTLAVGDHVRLPRTYRGMDIHWWMETIGLLDELDTDMEDLNRARRLPSLQLVGSPEKRSIGCNELSEAGVELVGRLAGVATDTDGSSRAQFSGGFANALASADLKLGRLLDRIDEHATEQGLDGELAPPDRPSPTVVPEARTALRLNEVQTVVWATGFVPHYPWLQPHLLDRKGAIAHSRGVMNDPGMYVLGLPFTRRRKSSFIDGVGPDAIELSEHLVGYLNQVASPAGAIA